MTLQRFEAVLNQLQKESPRVFDALTLLGREVKFVLDNNIISSILVASQPTQIEANPPTDIFKLIGWVRNSTFRTVFTVDSLDKVSIGGAGQPNGKLQVEEITNDHTATEVLTLKRSRQDTTAPNANFGSKLSFRLSGFTVDSEPEAGRIQLIWEQNQTNDTTQRDSEISLWNMVDNVLTKVFSIASSGAITPATAVYVPNRFLIVNASGVIVTLSTALYDEATDKATFSSAHATEPELHLLQSSTGDAYARFSLSSSVSWAIGLDNSDSDKFKLSRNTAENAVPGTNDVFEVDTSNRLGFGVAASSTYKFRINKTTESTVLQLIHSDALTTPSEELRQDSTGDVGTRFQIAAGNSFMIGIDNSDSDIFKLSYGSAGNAALGTNDYLTLDVSGRFGINVTPSSSFRFRVNKTTEATALQLIHSDALTSPSEEIRQDSTGDASTRWQLAAGNSYIVGIDNSDNDEFKIAYGSAGNAVLGTNDRLAIDSSGRFVLNGSTFTATRFLQINHFEEGPWIWCESAFLNPSIVMNNTASGGKQWQLLSSATGGIKAGQFTIRDATAASNKFGIDTNGNVIIGPEAALATTATDGFLYIPSCAGTPTGVPTGVTGKIPLVYDSTNNILYARSGGAWRAH